MTDLAVRSYTQSDEYRAIFAVLTAEERLYVEQYVRTGTFYQPILATTGQPMPKKHAILWLADPEIARAVRRLKAFYSRHVGLDLEDVVSSLKNAAFHDPIQAFTEQGIPLPFHEWPLELRECVQELQTDTYTDSAGRQHVKIRCKFVSRLKAQELLGRYLKMWEPETQSGTKYSLTIHMHPDQAPADPVLEATPVRRIEGAGVTVELPSPEEDDYDDS